MKPSWRPLVLRPRCVVLSTLATLGLLPEASAGRTGIALPSAADPAGLPGVLVAKYSPPWFTTAILQGRQVRLFRTVGLSPGPDGLLAAETVIEALYPSMVFFQDNFGGQLDAAWLCGLGRHLFARRRAARPGAARRDRSSVGERDSCRHRPGPGPAGALFFRPVGRAGGAFPRWGVITRSVITQSVIKRSVIKRSVIKRSVIKR